MTAPARPKRRYVSRLTPEQRSLSARAAALTRWSHVEDRTAATAPARAAFVEQLAEQVDPDGRLTPGERARRVDMARRAHMTRMTLAASRRRSEQP